MAEKLTNSQEVALRRIMTNAPGTPSRSMVRTALATGMSEREIMNTLRASAPTPKGPLADLKRAFSLDNDILQYMMNNTPGDALLHAFNAAKGPKLKGKPRAVSAAERAMKQAGAKRTITKAEGKSKPKAKTTVGGAQTVVRDGRPTSENKRALKKSTAKNFNVGVSKGGVPFKEAFAHFRKKGAKTFTWNGKKYTTELAKPKKGKK